MNSQNFFCSIPAGAENPSLSQLCYRRLWGSRNRRTLILGWVSYLDAFIRSALGYPVFIVGTITGTPEVRPSQSSHTRERSSQCSNAHTRYGPNCLTTFWTQLTYRFNGRTTQPLEHTTAPGGEEPTSRCQTFPSMWALGKDQPVIPRATFIRWATTLPLGIVGSLRLTFVPARRVGLAVKLPSAFALKGQSPSGLRKPLHASVTFREAYAP